MTNVGLATEHCVGSALSEISTPTRSPPSLFHLLLLLLLLLKPRNRSSQPQQRPPGEDHRCPLPNHFRRRDRPTLEPVRLAEYMRRYSSAMPPKVECAMHSALRLCLSAPQRRLADPTRRRRQPRRAAITWPRPPSGRRFQRKTGPTSHPVGVWQGSGGAFRAPHQQPPPRLHPQPRGASRLLPDG